jgi:hypothetical protein
MKKFTLPYLKHVFALHIYFLEASLYHVNRTSCHFGHAYMLLIVQAYLDSSRELLSIGRCLHIIFTSQQHIFLQQKVAPFH